uniref:ATP-dependent DNA helicase n=1 Tax=Amphimedon queenslandica TaxID=400682 RepID=A0A1X7UXB6_AMPQE
MKIKKNFHIIKSHHVSQKDNMKLLRMFVSGVGGTGKSFLIEAIKCLVDDIWHPERHQIMCAIVATT